MRKTKIALLALLFIPLAACASAQGSADDAEEVVIDYRGGELHCMTAVYDRGMGMACDYERFYNENSVLR